MSSDDDALAMVRFLEEMQRIVASDGADLGIAFPSTINLEEAVQRLKSVPDGAGWEAVDRVLNSPASA